MTMTIDNALARWPQLGAPSFCHALQHWARSTPDQPAVSNLDASMALSWREYSARIESVASGLHSLGVRRGDTVALMLTNRPEFNVVDAAAIHLRAIPFSIYNTLAPEDLGYALRHAGPAVVVTEIQFLSRVLAARPANVRHIVLVDGTHADAISLDQLAAAAPSLGPDLQRTWEQASGDDVVTLIYTSGTTGKPKAVQLSHRNVHTACLGLACSIGAKLPANPAVLSWLPSAHVADRVMSHYWMMTFGGSVTSVADPQAVGQALAKVHPAIFSTVPRFLEKLKTLLQASGVADPSALPPVAKQAILSKIGFDRLTKLMTGGAPASYELHQFYRDLGVPVCEAWGMSEAAGISILTPEGAHKPGWIGTAMHAVEVRLAPDGELLVRSPAVTQGYLHDPERTAAAIDADGWLLTGDLAEMDGEGYVRIVGRKKELIINAAGKNMSPGNIEYQVKAADSLLGHVVAIGDRRPYNVALVLLDPVVAQQWAKDAGVDYHFADVATHPAIRARLCEAMRRANEKLSRVEQIKRFAILGEDWLPGGDELTPTAKLRRASIHKKYAEVIDRIYDDPAFDV